MNSEKNSHETPKFHTIKIQRSEIFPESQKEMTDADKGDVKRLSAERQSSGPDRGTGSEAGQDSESAATPTESSAPLKIKRRGLQSSTRGPVVPPKVQTAGQEKQDDAPTAQTSPITEPPSASPDHTPQDAGESTDSGGVDDIRMANDQAPAQPTRKIKLKTKVKLSEPKPPEPAVPHPAESDTDDAVSHRPQKTDAPQEHEAPPEKVAIQDQSATEQPAPKSPSPPIKKKDKKKEQEKKKEPTGSITPVDDKSAPPAAPAPAADHAEANAEPAPAAAARPKLQSGRTKLPANLSEPPPAPAASKRQQAPGGSNAQRRGWAAPIGALVLFAAGNVLTIKPQLESWVADGRVPTPQLLVLGITTLLMAFLLLSRKIALRILASLILLLMIGYCVVALLLPVMWESLPAQMTSAPEFSRLTEFGSPGVLLGSANLFLGSLFLVFGSGAVLWTLAIICLLAGVTMPFVPVGNVLPQPVGQPIRVEMAELDMTLPGGWIKIEDTETERVFKTLDAALTMRVQHHTPAEPMTLDDFVDTVRESYRKDNPDAAQFSTSVPGSPSRKKLFMLGDTRRETLIVQTDAAFYTVAVQGTEEELKAREADIDAVFRNMPSE